MATAIFLLIFVDIVEIGIIFWIAIIGVQTSFGLGLLAQRVCISKMSFVILFSSCSVGDDPASRLETQRRQ